MPNSMSCLQKLELMRVAVNDIHQVLSYGNACMTMTPCRHQMAVLPTRGHAHTAPCIHLVRRTLPLISLHLLAL